MSRRTQNMNDIDEVPKKRRRKVIKPSSDEDSEPEQQQVEHEDAEMLDDVSFIGFSCKSIVMYHDLWFF